MIGFDEPGPRPHGRILGDYFDVVAMIGTLEAEFGVVELEENETYHRLLESRFRLEARLEEASDSHADSVHKAAVAKLSLALGGGSRARRAVLVRIRLEQLDEVAGRVFQ